MDPSIELGVLLRERKREEDEDGEAPELDICRSEPFGPSPRRNHRTIWTTSSPDSGSQLAHEEDADRDGDEVGDAEPRVDAHHHLRSVLRAAWRSEAAKSEEGTSLASRRPLVHGNSARARFAHSCAMGPGSCKTMSWISLDRERTPDESQGARAWSLAFVGVFVAIACSSGGTNTLGNTGAGGSSSGGGSDCSPQGSTAGDGELRRDGGMRGVPRNQPGGSLTPLVLGQEPGLVVQAGHILYPPNLTPTRRRALATGRVTAFTRHHAGREQHHRPGRVFGDGPALSEHVPGRSASAIASFQSIPAVVNQIPQSCCPPAKGVAPCVAATSTPDGG